jgi:hypothetical protein
MEGTMIDSSPVAGDARWPLLAYMLTLPPRGLVVNAPQGANSQAVPPPAEVDSDPRGSSDELPYGQPVERMRDIAAGHQAAQVVSSGVQGGSTA